MSTWFNSKRLLILLVAIIATSEWGGSDWNGIPVPTPDVWWTGMLAVTYIGGQSLVDFGKALKGGRA